MQRRFFVTLLAIASLCVYGPVATASSAVAATVQIQGAVMAADGMTAVQGAVVKAAHMESRTVFTSAPTTANGTYSLTGLPAGSYDLAIETDDGVFISDAFVQPEPGKQTVVSFSLQPPDGTSSAEGDDEGDKGEGSTEGEGSGSEGSEGKGETKPDPEPAQQTQKKKTGGFFKTPGGAALVIILTGGLLGAAANSATKNETDLNIPSLTPGS